MIGPQALTLPPSYFPPLVIKLTVFVTVLRRRVCQGNAGMYVAGNLHVQYGPERRSRASEVCLLFRYGGIGRLSWPLGGFGMDDVGTSGREGGGAVEVLCSGNAAEIEVYLYLVECVVVFGAGNRGCILVRGMIMVDLRCSAG